MEDCVCSHTYLENIISGKKTRISQLLGNGAKGCKLDPHMLLQLAEELLQQLNCDTNLLIINRFGRREAEGHGFRSAIEKAFAMDNPVLVAVRDEYLEDWKKFSGDCAKEIPSDLKEVLVWYNNVATQEAMQPTSLEAMPA